MLVACWGGGGSLEPKVGHTFGVRLQRDWWALNLLYVCHSFTPMSRLLSPTPLCCAWQLCSLSNLCLSVLENNFALFSVLQRFSRGRWQKHNGSPSYCLWSAYWVVIPSSLHSPHRSSNQEHICTYLLLERPLDMRDWVCLHTPQWQYETRHSIYKLSASVTSDIDTKHYMYGICTNSWSQALSSLNFSHPGTFLSNKTSLLACAMFW